MLDALTVIASGILLGLSMAAPPGPVNAMIASEAIKSNLHGTAVGAGAMTADFIFFVLMLFVSDYIPSAVIPWLYILGGLLMLYFAYGVLKARPVKTKISGSYIKGLKLGLTNPYQITWWIAYGIPMISHFSFLIGPSFFLGILVWILTYPYVVHKLGGLSDKAVIGIKLFSFAVLLAFGVYAIVVGVQGI
ncbi:MAG: LysE family translocator [Thermoprotei archaeon]